jgi:hypothetical protein
MPAPGPLPAAGGGTGRSTPYVADGMVVAGAVEFPIPAGWRVVTANTAEPCGNLPRTILLIVSDQRGCQYASVEVSRTDRRNPGGAVLNVVSGNPLDINENPITSPVSVTCRVVSRPGWSRRWTPGRCCRAGTPTSAT